MQSAHPDSPPTTPRSGSAIEIFRREALDHYVRGQGRDGDVLRLTPTWTRWTYWLLLVVVATTLCAAAVFTLDDYVDGTAVVLVEDAHTAPTLIALLPGYVYPQLQPGMPLRVTLDGYPYASQSTTIDSVADQIVGPKEVERRLGSDLADTLTLAGPVVIVQARLPANTFQADGRSLAYFTGMQGRAEVQIGSQRILLLLAPGLQTFFDASN